MRAVKIVSIIVLFAVVLSATVFWINVSRSIDESNASFDAGQDLSSQGEIAVDCRPLVDSADNEESYNPEKMGFTHYDKFLFNGWPLGGYEDCVYAITEKKIPL